MLPECNRGVCLVAECGQCFSGRTLAEDNYGRRGKQPVREKGDRSNLPERPEGGHHACMVVAQIGPVPFFLPGQQTRKECSHATDLLGLRRPGRGRPEQTGGRFRLRLRLGQVVHQLRAVLHVRRPGLRSPVFRLAAGLLPRPAFTLRQRLGRLLRGEGPVEGLLVPAGHRRKSLVRIDARGLPADAGGSSADQWAVAAACGPRQESRSAGSRQGGPASRCGAAPLARRASNNSCGSWRPDGSALAACAWRPPRACSPAAAAAARAGRNHAEVGLVLAAIWKCSDAAGQLDRPEIGPCAAKWLCVIPGKRGQVQFAGTARDQPSVGARLRTNWTCPLFPLAHGPAVPVPLRTRLGPCALGPGADMQIPAARRDIGTYSKIGSRISIGYADLFFIDLPGGRDINCPVSG